MVSKHFEAAEIVTAIYRVLLLREPDADGLASAAAHLRNTHGLESLLRGVLQSSEFRDRLSLFLSYYQPEQRLGEPDPSDLQDHPFSDPAVLDAHLRAHPALKGDVLHRLGEPIVKLASPRIYRCSRVSERNELTRHGVRIHDVPNSGELLVAIDSSAKPFSLEIKNHGHSNNIVVLGPDCAVFGEIQFGGCDNLAYLGGRPSCPQTYSAAIYSHSCAFVFGQDSTSVGSSFHLEGPSQHMIVGRDCMFSAEVYVAGTDNHAVVDLTTGRVLNLGESLTIGPHTWLGFGATVLKGAHVGEGSVLAARTVLTTPCPAHTLMVGSPARQLRDNISWDRDFPAVVASRQHAREVSALES